MLVIAGFCFMLSILMLVEGAKLIFHGRTIFDIIVGVGMVILSLLIMSEIYKVIIL